MKLWLVSVACAVMLRGQQDPEKIRAAMQASIELQKASVLKQPVMPPFPALSWPETPKPAEAAGCDSIPEPELSRMIEAAAKKEDLKPDLVRAVIRRESAARPCAVSPKGAAGLMQLMPETAAQFHVGDPFDPKQNLDAGTRYLKELLVRYAGNLRLALSAYNAGPAVVDKTGAVPDIAETRTYVRSILDDLKIDSH